MNDPIEQPTEQPTPEEIEYAELRIDDYEAAEIDEVDDNAS